jgi:hypothetical protein
MIALPQTFPCYRRHHSSDPLQYLDASMLASHRKAKPYERLECLTPMLTANASSGYMRCTTLISIGVDSFSKSKQCKFSRFEALLYEPHKQASLGGALMQ